MFDAHCHLELLADPRGAWKTAQEHGVREALVAGVDPAGWERQQQLSLPGLHHAFGLHPWRTDLESGYLDAILAKLATLLPGAAAVGETGLDLRPGQPPRERQLAALRAQLALARERELPVVLHVVKAHAEVMRVIDTDGLPSAGAVVHGFTGSAGLVREWCRRGCFLSVGGPVTWPRSPKRAAGLLAVPETRLLVETDAPDQAPEPWRSRGEPGSPHMLPAVVRALAELRETCPDQLARTTASNARRLLGCEAAG